METTTSAASTGDSVTTPTTDATETPVQSATDETTSKVLDVTTQVDAGDDEGEVKPESNDGKIDAAKVNEIVKRRVEKVREKTREQTRKEADEEIEFWRLKAKEQKVETPLFQVPPKPKMADYGSNPTQYEVDIEQWSKINSQAEQARNKILTDYGERVVKFKKDKPDFDKSVTFFNNVTVSPILEGAILESELGPNLSYYLSKNFKEFDRINKLSPISVARELGKLELKLTGQLKEEKPVDNKPVVPKPTTPVSGSAPQTKSVVNGQIVDVNKFIEERKKFHAKGRINR